jgi:hypothetical protein
MPEAALAFLRESILHGLVAAGVVLALLRLWRLHSPGARLRFLWLALAFPTLVQPALFWLAAQRRSPSFAEDQALFVSGRYAELVMFGARSDALVAGCLAWLALLLLMRDVLPLVVDRVVPRPAAALDEALEARVREALAGLDAPPTVPRPRLRLVDAESHEISCSGLRRGELVVSTAAARELHPRELRAALAHELAHLRYRDPQTGWALMAVRALCFFNPAVQLLARLAAREMECRADDQAVALASEPAVLAASLVKAFRRGLGHRPLGRLLEPLRVRALERRCRRLLEPAPGPGIRAEALHLGATAAGLFALLLFVV